MNTKLHVCFAGLIVCMLVLASKASDKILWREASFTDFIDGTFEDGAANTYVSRRGAIQLVNRWDYNNDGFMDLVFVSSHDHRENLDAFIYPNRNGEFLEMNLRFLPTDGGNFALIQDLNADGFSDVIVANTTNGTLGDLDSFIYWGSAQGLSPLDRSEVPTVFAGKPTGADLNKDGYIDVVFPNGSDFAIHPGDEAIQTGSFIYWGGKDGYRKDRRQELPTFNAKAAVCADFDGDGWLDVAFANNKPAALVIANTAATEAAGGTELDSYVYWGGPQGFAAERRSSLRTDQAVTLRTYNADGDGRPDLVFLDKRGLVICRHTGNRQFRMDLIAEAKGANDFVLADLNRDRKTDLVLSATPAKVISGKGGLEFDFAHAVELPTLNALSCEVSDLNEDGYPDLVFANNRDDQIYDVCSYIYWNSADGFASGRRSELPGTGPRSVAVGDVDNDGHPDLLLMNTIGGHVRTSTTYLYMGNADGKYSAADHREIETIDANDAASADLNDDGFTDLVLTERRLVRPTRIAGRPSTALAAEEGYKNGRIEAFPIYWGGPHAFLTLAATYLPFYGSYGVSVADLNRDGYLDLVVSGYFRRPGADTEYSRIFFGSDKGFSIDRKQDLEAPGAEPAVIADFNRDGWLDLVFPDRSSGQEKGAILYFGSAAGYSKQNSTLLPTANSTRGQTADLNGDSWLDLIFTNQIESGSQFTPTLIYWGSPRGFAVQHRTELPTWGGYGCSVADFNRDGFLDIAVPTYKGYRTRTIDSTVFWGSAQGFLETAYTHLPSYSGAECLAADFNQDGWTDLLIICHKRDGDHQAAGRLGEHITNSFLYWNGPGGFNPKPLLIPSVGAHSNNSVDFGNMYDRKARWGYISSPFQFGDRPPESIHWEVKTPFHTTVQFQVRTAATREQLDTAPWRGPSAEKTYYAVSGGPVGEIPAGHRWMQYRLELVIQKGVGNPEVTAVEFKSR